MRWIIDGSAINRIATESKDCASVFTSLTPFVESGDLSFCDEVVSELERTADNAALVWASTAKGHRHHTGAGMSTRRWIAFNVSEIVDPEGRHDAAPEVLAQARSLITDGHPITVVTEDLLGKPTRASLTHACARLSIPWCQVPELMSACSISWP